MAEEEEEDGGKKAQISKKERKKMKKQVGGGTSGGGRDFWGRGLGMGGGASKSPFSADWMGLPRSGCGLWPHPLYSQAMPPLAKPHPFPLADQ